MSTIDNQQPPKTRRFWRRVAIVPVCLCLVAGLHAVRVATMNQTPWKGGGFGMFSTVDSEAARFLRIYAVTPDGDLPLVIPDRWQKRSWELRAAPTAAAAQELAECLSELPWQHPDRPVVDDPRLETIPQGKPTERVVPVWEVRVECWRLVFDRATKVLRSEKLLAEDSHSFVLPIPAAARLNPPTPDPRLPTPDSMIAVRRPTFRPLWLDNLAWPRLDPLRVLPLLTVVLLLTSAPDQWYLRGPLVALFALGVAFRSWLTRPYFWYAVATLLGTTIYLNWATCDNHKYLFVYWTLALCTTLTLKRPQQAEALALSSRRLIGLCMLLAALWKAITPQYLDGTFFEYTLLCDERFAGFTNFVAGLPFESLAANRELRELMQEGHLRGQVVSEAALGASPAVAVLAQAMTWWTIGIEGLLAALFLWPDNRHVAGLRNVALLIFAATTYLIAPVRGFGWILMLLGMAQCRDDERRERLAYLLMLVVIQLYTLPVGDVVKLLAG